MDEPGGAVHREVARRSAATAMQKGGDAARAIAALLDLDAIRVEDAIEDRRVRPFGRLEHEGLVETDAGVARRESAPLGDGGQRGPRRCIEDDEVVPEPMHL